MKKNGLPLPYGKLQPETVHKMIKNAVLIPFNAIGWFPCYWCSPPYQGFLLLALMMFHVEHEKHFYHSGKNVRQTPEM